MDVTAIVADIAQAGTDIGTVGAAIVAVAAIVFGIRWVKAMLF